jgi:adenylate kinase family enzyme
VIIGNAGSGKSRLAEGLARSTEIPLHRLDAIQWNPGWVRTAEEDFRREHDRLAERESWILDGVASWGSIVHRIERCDTIVYVDLPLWIHYWWAAKRQFPCLFRPRPNFVPGCPMLPKTWALAKMMWWIHKVLRPKLMELIESHRDDKHLYVLHSPRDVNQFYERSCA